MLALETRRELLRHVPFIRSPHFKRTPPGVPPGGEDDKRFVRGGDDVAASSVMFCFFKK